MFSIAPIFLLQPQDAQGTDCLTLKILLYISMKVVFPSFFLEITILNQSDFFLKKRENGYI